MCCNDWWHNVIINKEKSEFEKQEVDFVGHRISAKGVAPIHSHIEAITNIEAPKSLKQLRRLLGCAGYYRKFVPHYADIIEPLNELLRHDEDFRWSVDCKEAFESLKSALTSANVLAHIDPNLDTIVTTDASGVALGAVLSQIQIDSSERPVAFASRTLSSAERAYSVSEREALACMWACEHWHWFLYGRKFTIRTDHSALTTLLAGGTKGRKPMRLLRWADRLNQYDFIVTYKPGVTNVVADMLSRPEQDMSSPNEDIKL